MRNKICNKYSVSIFTFIAMVIAIVSLVFSIYTMIECSRLNNDINSNTQDMNKTSTEIQVVNKNNDDTTMDSNKNAISDESKIINDEKEISDYYQKATDHSISSINATIAILCVVATVFGFAGVLMTWINLNASSKLNEIDRISKEVESLDVMKHFIKGLYFENSGKIAYAIKEYEEGLDLKYENSGILNIQLSSLYSDVYNKTNNRDFLDQSLLYLKEDCKECDKRLLAEYYDNKGCINGLKAKLLIFNKEDDKEIKNTLEESIDYIKKAIRLQTDDYSYYKNAALSYYYLDDKENVIKYLKDAKGRASFNKMISSDKKDVFDIFDYKELRDMGVEIFNKYRKAVGYKEENEEEFEKRIQIRKDKAEKAGVKVD